MSERSLAALTYEEIAGSVNGAQKTWFLRIGFQLAAELPHVDVHCTCVWQCAVSPDRSQQFITENDAPAVPDQVAQHVELEARKFDRLTRP
jgi:hypothetical protein